ncbi:hypothetical protein Salat_1470300 [Sesamum alatum]|uniref:Uncharacterized protein n=1 Tax=Sesamum alatum TaxID=300844 RepID=A0AAE1YB74_9LAMI|nr:hypothetical protein Salat_1470300 [Sesamum alatum]
MSLLLLLGGESSSQEETTKFTRADTDMRLKPMLDLARNMPSQPTRILIPGHGLGFKDLSYDVLKKQMKTGIWITKKLYILGNDVSVQATRDEIVAIEGTSPARRSKDAIPNFSQETCIPSHNAYPAAACVVLPSKRTSSYSMVYLWVILYASLVNTNACQMLIAITGALLLKILQFSKHRKWLHYIASFKYLLKALLINKFKCRESVSGTSKDVSEGPLGEKTISKLHNTTMADPKWNWKLIDKDDLFTVDVYSIGNFCISISILLAWRILCQLFVYVVRRFIPSKTEDEA